MVGKSPDAAAAASRHGAGRIIVDRLDVLHDCERVERV
jgi:hypothetical protein